MATKPTKPFRMAPLQRLKVRPIEDLAEQAALDERLKRCSEAGATAPVPETEGPGATSEASDATRTKGDASSSSA